MKLLYGVVGEGMGHAIRSRVVLEHLVREHEVEIVTSNRAADFLSKVFPEVHRIHGLHIVSEENRVRKGKTLWSNVRDGVAELPGQIQTYFRLIEDFEPDAVISDFESWTYFYAKAHRLPVFSIDNMQIINRCTHPDAILEGRRADFQIAKTFVKSKLPGCDHYFITTFFHPPIRKERTSLHPPILRREILEAESRRGEHLLVYQTSTSHDALLDALRGTGMECRVYGLRRDLQEDHVDGALRFRPFSETTFIEDLATARAVVASAGFTLAGECVYLHKPLMAVPLGGQFEQTLNARYLEREGYGVAADVVDEVSLARFLEAIPRCEEALAGYSQDGNAQLLAALDAELDRAAAGLY